MFLLLENMEYIFRLGRKQGSRGYCSQVTIPQGVLADICQNIGTGKNAVIKGDWKCMLVRLL